MNAIQNSISEGTSLRNAMKMLDDLLKQDISTLFVLNNDNQLIGTVTDGDIRRGIIAGAELENKISSVMQQKFSFLVKDKFTLDEIKEIKDKKIQFIPIINEDKNLVKVIDLKKIKTILPLSVVIIAGGEGKRLKPLTDTIPKPLLKVGHKPIMEHNIDRLIYFGVDKFFISVNYLSDQIIAHFGDGAEKGVNIKYVKEEKPLGTIGSVSLIDKIDTEYLLISNSDLLTNVDYEDMFRTFIENDADLIVATSPYRVNVPYGVMEVTPDDQILGLKEKPTYTYFSNAGIYLIKKKHLELMPKNQFWNATDLIEAMIRLNLNVRHYQILSYWLDIGMMEDYMKAQEDINHISLM